MILAINGARPTVPSVNDASIPPNCVTVTSTLLRNFAFGIALRALHKTKNNNEKG
jgi:hypothetical protein